MTSSLSLTAPAVPRSAGEIRCIMRAHFEALQLQQWQIADILEASGEAALNVIEHAYSHLTKPGDLNVTAMITDNTVILAILDQGVWKTQPPRLGRGHGFEMMRGLAGRVSIKEDGEGTVVYMNFPLDAGGKSLLQQAAS